jgi:hypothetical protein
VKRSLRTTWQAASWRNPLILLAAGQIAIYMDSREEHPLGYWMGHPSAGYVAMALLVLLIIPIALLSDEAVDRGASARFAYAIAAISTLPVALLTTTATQHAYLSIFGLPPGTADQFWVTSIAAGVHFSIYGAFGMLVFINQRTADRMLENFRKGELRRVELERQLVNSRLATAEAQIDPTMLFDRLAEVKLGFQRGEDHAEARLNELIQSLRAALARTVSAHESVANTPP